MRAAAQLETLAVELELAELEGNGGHGAGECLRGLYAWEWAVVNAGFGRVCWFTQSSPAVHHAFLAASGGFAVLWWRSRKAG
jgi:hypothetical protein